MSPESPTEVTEQSNGSLATLRLAMQNMKGGRTRRADPKMSSSESEDDFDHHSNESTGPIDCIEEGKNRGWLVRGNGASYQILGVSEGGAGEIPVMVSVRTYLRGSGPATTRCNEAATQTPETTAVTTATAGSVREDPPPCSGCETETLQPEPRCRQVGHGSNVRTDKAAATFGRHQSSCFRRTDLPPPSQRRICSLVYTSSTILIMTRGRSIDKTIPPSRALAQQRDYRARKAARIESLEEELERLRAENDSLRAELREARLGNARGDDQLGRSVVNIRQHLLKALDAVNQLDGDCSPSRSGPTSYHNHNAGGSRSENPTSGSDRLNTTHMTGHPPQYPSPSSSSLHPPSLDIDSSLSMEVYDPTCCAGIIDCSSLPPVDSQPEPPHPNPVPPRPDVERATPAVEVSYDAECCGGIFDCSHLPPAEDGEAEKEDRRALSHCRAEERVVP
ncbi:uncharacterized protein MKK02DRAFT_29876 [Dioszegia hungarica]|uniref:BZIP domain-containing protein n=1 Tax=Dioszegia hungarica TaxID=4972 RepID=A0AA38HG74_9TREE|nr:uncharacterized protein MKK02DRAFT_29876 [Dioszegia hungarica]KAI9639907.1 hypothetical protein MKK02DRAFT_29876 [Dioszegia hungarica]